MSHEGNPHRPERADLGPEHPWGDRGQALFQLAFFVVWLVDSFIFGVSTLFANYVPLYIRLPLAGFFFALGLWLSRVTDRIVFAEVRDPPRVIDSGVFAHVRHPMYLGSLCMDLGLFMTTCSIFCLDILAVMFVFYDRIAAFEERDLAQRFGNEYANYARRVRRWVPRP
jgi:protein-S-isoprenylcysteine O-methyltransferase Ste14